MSESEKLNPSNNYCGIIYMATCKITNMSYIGQTKSHKLNCGKWKQFGIKGR